MVKLASAISGLYHLYFNLESEASLPPDLMYLFDEYMLQPPEKYGLRFRAFVWHDEHWSEPFRFTLKQLPFAIEMVWDNIFHYRKKYRQVYLIIPGIVDINDHLWNLHDKRKRKR